MEIHNLIQQGRADHVKKKEIEAFEKAVGPRWNAEIIRSGLYPLEKFGA